MIEDQLSSMPARETDHQRGKRRQREPVGQDGIGIVQSESPIGPADRHQSHRSNGMRPAGFQHPYATDKQQFAGPGEASRNASPESHPRRPDAGTQPEFAARPPINEVDAEGRDNERDRKMNHHNVNRMSDDRNRRTGIERLKLQSHRALLRRIQILINRHHVRSSSARLNSGSNRRVFSGVVYTTLSGFLTGCAGPLSTIDPAGPAARSIATLWWVMLAGATVLFLLCMTLFALAVSRRGLGRKISARRWVVLGGLVLPTIVLGPLLVYALISGERLLPHLLYDPLRIEANAKQWQWIFSYPDNGGAQTVGILHLPAGTPVDVVVTSQDVIHAFWIPRLAGKIDAVPGHTNVLRIEADRPGRYQGICNEFCGTGHTGMRFDVVVHRAAEFAATLASPNAEGKVSQ